MTPKKKIKDNKVNQLQNITEQIIWLETSPLYDYRIKNGYIPVIGEGDPEAKIMFIGEAPGSQEAKTGRPFVGRAGTLLDSLLKSINLGRGEIYITNIVKDRPPKNRTPLVGEIKIYAPFLLEQIEIIQPSLIVTLGRLAMRFILKTYDLPQKDKNIGELHGKAIFAQTDIGKLTILPLYHPAAVFYNRDIEQILKEDFKNIDRIINNS